MELKAEFKEAVNHWLDAELRDITDETYKNKVRKSKLSGNHKGVEAAQQLSPVIKNFGLEWADSRVLEVGCGLGGFLVSVAQAGAGYCEGWEVSEDRAKLSRLNLACHTQSQDSRVKIQSIDDEALWLQNKNEQRFDVIYSEQVLEHVKDIHAATGALAKLLSPDGVLINRLPNGFSINQVLKDPHLLLFGISLLHRFEAHAIVQKLTGSNDYSSNMGVFLSWPEYVAMFTRSGMHLWLSQPSLTQSKIIHLAEKGLNQITTAKEDFQIMSRQALKSEEIDLVVESVSRYSDRLEFLIEKTRDRSREIRNAAINEIKIDYLMDQFYFCASYQEPSRHPFESGFMEKCRHMIRYYLSPFTQSIRSGLTRSS